MKINDKEPTCGKQTFICPILSSCKFLYDKIFSDDFTMKIPSHSSKKEEVKKKKQEKKKDEDAVQQV